ncbi:MAG: ABC transporter ATP-binding protein [Tepidiformaceae bacterium]
MRYLLRLLHFFKPFKWWFVLAFTSVILAGIFTMVSPVLIGYAITFGLHPEGKSPNIVLHGNIGLLVLACAGIVALAIGKGLSLFGQQYLGETIGQKVAYDIRNAIYDNLQRLSYAYHDTAQTGQIMSRVTQDVEGVRMFVSMGFLRSLYIVVVLAVSIGGMFIISWQLALVSLVTLPFMAWRSFVLARTVRPVWLSVQQNIAEVTRVAEEALTGIRVVKAFSREDFESEQFYKASKDQADLSYTASRIMAVNQPALTGLGSLQIAITVGVGAWMITQGTLSPADLLTFALWLNLLQLPVRTMGFALTFVARCISSSERIFELLDAQSAVQEKPNAPAIENVQGHIKFEGVGFGYNNLSAVLTGVDIDATPGKVIALLGPPGSGKSTVVNLIPRFYDVTEGRITLDGVDIRDVTLDSLRKNIGIVQQDVFLFIGTIRDNIAYGRPEATQEEIENAAKAARIHDFIVSLPYGYEEWVGERGVTLSGGQKQRIAIARTLIMDPRILIFDDSTASVDTQTEFLIQQALQELMKGRTTFVIAQRLRTIMRADEIVVLDRGTVVQRGRHDELLAEDGLYRRIYDLELKDQEEALGHVVAEVAHEGAPSSAPAAGGAA